MLIKIQLNLTEVVHNFHYFKFLVTFVSTKSMLLTLEQN